MDSKDSLIRSRRLLSIVIVFFWASEYAHVPYFTPYLNQLGFSASLIGIMTGTYGLTQTLARIPLGIATDATAGYRRVVIMGTVFTTVSSFGLMFASSAWFIIFCRFLAGMAASTWLAFSVLYSAYFDASEGVTAMTNINVFNNAGKLLAFALGTLTAAVWGIKRPLLVSFLTGVAAVAFALTLKEVPIRKEPMKLSGLAATFRNPGVLIPACFAAVLQMVCHGTAFSFTSRVAEGLGASNLQIGINTALFTIVQVAAGTWIRKHFTQKAGNSRAAAGGFLCLLISCTLIGTAPSLWFVYLGQIIGGTGNIILMSLLMAMSIRTVPSANKSTAMGLFQAVYGVGMTIGPILMGKIVDLADYRTGYLIFAVTCAAALILSLLLVPELDRRARAV